RRLLAHSSQTGHGPDRGSDPGGGARRRHDLRDHAGDGGRDRARTHREHDPSLPDAGRDRPQGGRRVQPHAADAHGQAAVLVVARSATLTAGDPTTARVDDAESARLAEDARREKNWKRWGPYLSERQWGTVREDYSASGEVWAYFTHDHARSR